MSHEHDKNEETEVGIIVNSQERGIDGGSYLVSFLKEQWGIPADHELNLVKDGQFHALNDDETIEVHDGDEFISQVKTGGAS